MGVNLHNSLKEKLMLRRRSAFNEFFFMWKLKKWLLKYEILVVILLENPFKLDEDIDV